MRKKESPIYKIASVGFLSVSALLILYIAYLSFSRAAVVLIPEQKERAASVKITIDAGKKEIDLENRIIPGMIAAENFEKTYENILIDSKTMPAKAAGKVVIHNKRDTQQYLLIESQLEGEKNKGIIFFTDKAITVPAFGSVEMPITAKEPGAAGNIPAQRFNFVKFSSSMQKLVYAESANAARGGSAEGSALTQEDLDAAKEKYSQDFFVSLKTKLAEKLAESSKTIKKELANEKITEAFANIPIGTSAEKFNLTIKGSLSAIAFNENYVASIAELVLKSSAPETEEFIKYSPEALTYSGARAYWDAAKADIEIQISGWFISRISPSLFQKEALIGMEKNEAIKYLESFEEIKSAEIHFFPPWNSTIPGGLKSNIKIEIKNEF